MEPRNERDAPLDQGTDRASTARASTARTSAAVIGPGAIGGTLGSALATNPDVSLTICARSRFDRLVVRRHDSVEESRPLVVTDPADLIGPMDLVVLAAKTYQTAGCAGWLTAACGPDTVVAVCQNGVEHHERMAGLIEHGIVVPVVVQIPAERHGPGEIEVRGRSRLVVADTEAGRRVAAAFDGTSIDVVIVVDWLSQAWSKLMTNAAIGSITALARTRNGVIADPAVRELAISIMTEVAAVARAEGASIDEDLPRRLADGIVGVAGGHLSSITADRLAGRPTEWDARNGVVVRCGDRHGIDVPINRAMATLLRIGEPADSP